jgi:retinol dehydrogenase-13
MKIALVTGAYGAIGKAIAEGIARVPGYHVVLTGRDEQRLHKALKELQQKNPKLDLSARVLDVSKASDIRRFAGEWQGPLHVLVNNAATSPRKRLENSEGIEMQFATNVLGYCRMIDHMHPFMKGLENPRIVNIASYWAGGLDVNDLEFKYRPYDNDSAYKQSKQANRMLSVSYADSFNSLGITVNSCHPGDVNSKLSNDLGFGGHETPEQGAATPVVLATDPSLVGISGKYFMERTQRNCEFAGDRYGIQRLIEICGQYNR